MIKQNFFSDWTGGDQIFRYHGWVNSFISEQLLMHSGTENHSLKLQLNTCSMLSSPFFREESRGNQVEWIMFWDRSGRIYNLVPWARHSFTPRLWRNNLEVMLEWRCWYLFTCLLCELNKFVCPVSCKSQLLYPPCNGETQ